ncbi:MAG: TIGR03118 family protein [Bryobacteraceae bacterium]
MRRNQRYFYAASVLTIALWPNPARCVTNFVQTNLVADVDGVAANTDPNLVGTWGISASTASPFWVSNTTKGTSTLYNTAGVPNARVVVIPPSASNASKTGLPSGQIWNEYGGFAISAGKVPTFIFVTLDGTISSWNSTVGDGNTAVIKVDNGAKGASYLGLATAMTSTGPLLYAANFRAGTIDVFDTNYEPVHLPGAFFDPDLRAGYSPTNIQRFGRRLFVTYAIPDGHGAFIYGSGMGAVNVFDLQGNLVQRLVPDVAALNVPWGLALSGPNFGIFSYALIVANFGDGSISAFDPLTGNYLGTMQDGNGNNLFIDGLWGLQFGNGGSGGDAATLYFAAAPAGGQHGLFGALKPASDSNLP